MQYIMGQDPTMPKASMVDPYVNLGTIERNYS
jgi:hypothetical protein